jgi:hypothetical protein
MDLCRWQKSLRNAGFLMAQNQKRTNLSDDKPVAKMGHPDLDVGYPPISLGLLWVGYKIRRVGPEVGR